MLAVTTVISSHSSFSPHSRQQKLLDRQLEKLTLSREQVFDKLRDIPKRMQKLTHQVELLLDLAEDYASGRYREVRWYTLGVAVTAALYLVSPADAIPDWIPLVGQFDDLLVMGVALKLVRRDLRAYIEHRGLVADDYF